MKQRLEVSLKRGGLIEQFLHLGYCSSQSFKTSRITGIKFHATEPVISSAHALSFART